MCKNVKTLILKKLYFEDKLFNGLKAYVSFVMFFFKLFNIFYSHPSQVKYHEPLFAGGRNLFEPWHEISNNLTF